MVLDTTEQLELGEGFPGVTESRLPTEKDARFRYRYRNLRLLTESGGRLFLVPRDWPTDEAVADGDDGMEAGRPALLEGMGEAIGEWKVVHDLFLRADTVSGSTRLLIIGACGRPPIGEIQESPPAGTRLPAASVPW